MYVITTKLDDGGVLFTSAENKKAVQDYIRGLFERMSNIVEIRIVSK